jgi:hypothetical protein
VFDCSQNPAPSADQLKNVAKAFLKAWQCNGEPFPLLHLNGWGCYCGSGSTGLDTEPVDGYDACCRQHDIDWTAICRNTPDPDRPDEGCDCYVSVPIPTGCADGKPTFAANLNACQQVCAQELTKQFACYAQHYNNDAMGAPPSWAEGSSGNWCEWQHYPNPTVVNEVPPIVWELGPKRPFDELLPSYCRKSTNPQPTSIFGHYDPGPNVFTPGRKCELAKADCSGSVTACARSEDACHDMGGVPWTDGQGCTANVDVTARPCAYRDPNNLCDCPPPPLPNVAPLCDVGDAEEGDACNPCTGRSGTGGTCQRGADLLVCEPGDGAPGPSPSPAPSPTPSPAPSPTPWPSPTASPGPAPTPSPSAPPPNN